MRQSGTFGTSTEILALSEVHKLNFHVYAERKRPENNSYTTQAQPTKISKSEHDKDIYLLLLGNTESGHFELLEAPTMTQESSQRTYQETNENPTHQHKTKRKTATNEPTTRKNRTQLQQQTDKEETGKPKDDKTRHRMKWTMEDYEEIVWCHYYVLQTTGTSNLKDTFALWEKRNPNAKHKLNPNTLATQRRFILNNHKIPSEDLDKIKEQLKKEIMAGNNENENHREEQGLNPHKPKNNIETETEIIVREDNWQQSNRTDNQEEETEKEAVKQEIIQRMHLDENTEQEITRKPLLKINEGEKAKKQIKLANEAIQEILNKNPDEYCNITKLNKLIYAAAEIVQDILIPQNHNKNTKRPKSTVPPWKKRIETKIQKLRKDLSQLTECSKPQLSRRMVDIKKDLYTKYNIKSPRDYEQITEKLKQLIAAKTQRIKRYSKRSTQFQQNKLFQENTKKFYNSILGKKNEMRKTPTEGELKDYWKQIWEKDTDHNTKAEWIQAEYDKTSTVKEMNWPEITMEEIAIALSSISNWKAPGSDGIPNFWLKKLTASHEKLTKAYNELATGKQKLPEWLTKGKTYLIPKTEKSSQPKDTRPITCLNNIYKLLTKIIAERIQHHLSENKLMPNEQKGCVKNTYGCKDHLMTSMMVHKDSRENRKNLSLAWIDYRKAFDSVPHSWLIEVLKIYRTNATLLTFIIKSMKNWKTDLYLRTKDESVTIRNINIRCGIYQGDSLSPLLFCMALYPLSSLLSATNTGYTCKNENQKIHHLLYIDDLKLISKSDEELTEQLQQVKRFSNDIKMEFGLDKCAKATFLKGKHIKSENVEIDFETTIKALDQQETYKYLGIEEHDGVQQKIMKQKLNKEYIRRIRSIMNSELSAKNKITAINSLAVPVIQYSYGIIKWTQAELKKLDIKTRKQMNMHGALHPRSDVDRLYIPRKDGGRGMISIEASYAIAIEGLNNYLELKEGKDTYLGMVYRYNQRKCGKQNQKTKHLEHIEDNNPAAPETKIVKVIKERIKEHMKKKQLAKWKEKKMHGQIAVEAEKDTINRYQSWQWLTTANVKSETEALITACQEQALATNYMRTKIIKTGTDPKCRLCRIHNETTHHVVSGCPILAKRAYLERHNFVAAHLHYNICKAYNITVGEKWYEHVPEAVVNTQDVTIIWDTQVQTDRSIKANKPDIIIKDKKRRTCQLIDVAIPSDYNVTEKEAEKYLKYKDLQIETERMWNMKTTIVPIVIGATGLISYKTTEAIKQIPGTHNLTSLQKTVVLSTAHIIRKVL